MQGQTWKKVSCEKEFLELIKQSSNNKYQMKFVIIINFIIKNCILFLKNYDGLLSTLNNLTI